MFQSETDAARAGALSQTEREMLESQRQAEQRQARIVGRPASAGAASTGNGNGAGDPEAAAPTDPAGEEPFIPDYDDNIIFFIRENLARSRAPQPANPKTEPPGEAAPEHYEPTADDDGGQAPEQFDDDLAGLLGQRPLSEAASQPALPTAIRPIFANFPAELTTLRNWVMWRYVQKRGKSKPDKVPFQTDGKWAKPNDNSTWTTFDACCAAYNGGGFDGIGFVFDGKVGDDGLCYAGADFDRCIEDGKLVEPARSRIAQLQTYTEVSVSGTGVHCIVRAKPGATVKHTCAESGRSVEIYSSGRFFTFTGVPWGDACGSIRPTLAEVNALIAEAKAEASANASPAGSNGPAEDELFVDPTMANQGPSAFFRGMEIESLGEGIKDYWFDKLTSEQKDDVVHYLLGPIAENTKLFELGENGGNNDDYFNLITALAVSGAPHAEDYFVEFASKAKNADPEEALREKFRTCAKNANASKAQADGLEKITVGTLLHYARQAGVDLSPRALAERGWMGYPAIKWRDFAAKGKPSQSLANAVIAIKALGIVIRQDLFHHRTIVKHNGAVATVQEGILTDDTVGAIRSLINNTYRVDCGDANTLAAVKEIAREHAFDPVLDYLADCEGKWDRKKRIDTWVIDYLGCEDTTLNRAIGRLMLIASVRRARSPGCKFDQICVLEGVEGLNKSTAIRVLAGDENFSDQSVLNVSEREAQEQLEGVWLHESADLTGLRKAEVERVKAFASRQSDRARPAYARVLEERKRRCTQWATTNDDAYLASQTGNRRFWPLAVGNIDIDALRRDRDQLWGEAAALEAEGASIVLNPQLWPAAVEEQEKRRLVDTWEDVVESMPPSIQIKEGSTTKEVQIIYQSDGKELVRSADVLVYVLGVATGHQHSQHGKRLAQVMKQSRWETPESKRVSISGKQCRGYWRDAPRAAAPEKWKEWRQWLREWKEKLKNEPTVKAVHYEKWCTQDGPDDYYRRLVNGEPVCVRKDKSGYWYAFRGSELLGQAGCPGRFSTAVDAQTAVDRVAAAGDGWEWITVPD